MYINYKIGLIDLPPVAKLIDARLPRKYDFVFKNYCSPLLYLIRKHKITILGKKCSKFQFPITFVIHTIGDNDCNA